MTKGKLQLWIDILPITDLPAPRQVDITPRKPINYELRVIIWKVENVLLDEVDLLSGERKSDIYVKGVMYSETPVRVVANIDSMCKKPLPPSDIEVYILSAFARGCNKLCIVAENLVAFFGVHCEEPRSASYLLSLILKKHLTTSIFIIIASPYTTDSGVTTHSNSNLITTNLVTSVPNAVTQSARRTLASLTAALL
ncbi:unnamed protein product [Acanthoscelides obtectus]|uniref:Uncharacterized protein n=1 Tax=Acanthoscelides obtectus TaxID=200917 RepID=A0A9P0JU72_ACAOB|nr:unnamed protein product [Acanthoscelides obtectus]CAK1641330.1 Fer-1-like protein 4 [Acanthoscelides obtectus]